MSGNRPTSIRSSEDRSTAADVRHAGRQLPAGFRLQEFVIEGLVGEGGFSIVYLARDTRLQRQVALKEYIPTALAVRDPDGQVRPNAQNHRHTFELGLRSFVNEAQLLASFDHPSLIRVYRFWEQNGTAYMVMPYIAAPTLKQWLTKHRAPLDEAWLRALFLSLIDALELIHADHCYHRDIAPDNILLLGNVAGGVPPRPLLLDFGAARRVISDATQTLTVLLKPGYAPIEQYANSGGARQGPWTDIYALCSVMYATITRRAPVPSVGRIIDDEVVPLSRAAAGRYSPQLLATIDAGMAVRPEHRPQSMHELRAMLTGEVPAASRQLASATVPVPSLLPEPTLAVEPDARTGFRPDAVAASSRVAIAGERREPTLPPPTAMPALPPRRTDAAARKDAARPVPAAWIATMLALAGTILYVGWRLLSDAGTAPPPRAPVAAVPDAGSPRNDNASAAASAAPTASPRLADGPASAPVAVAPAPPPLYQSLPALQDLVRTADPRFTVVATVERPVMTIGRDRLRVRVQSVQDGYVYLYYATTDRRVYLLFPNRIDVDNRIEAGQAIMLPKTGWNLTAEGPPGATHVIAVVSRHPRDLGGSGLRPGRGIPDFDLRLAERWRPQQSNPFLGLPLCGASSCSDDAWGASLVEIQEVAAGPRN